MKVVQNEGSKSNIQADTLQFEMISWSWGGIFHTLLQFHSLISVSDCLLWGPLEKIFLALCSKTVISKLNKKNTPTLSVCGHMESKNTWDNKGLGF